MSFNSDPAQHPQTNTGQYAEPNQGRFHGDTVAGLEGPYTDPQDLANAGPQQDAPDVFTSHPGLFNVLNQVLTHRQIGQYLPVPLSGGLMAPGKRVFAGFAFREASGTAGAVVNIRDGYDANARLVCPLTLAANESVRDFTTTVGIQLLQGLYVEIASGTVQGTVYTLEERNV